MWIKQSLGISNTIQLSSWVLLMPSSSRFKVDLNGSSIEEFNFPFQNYGSFHIWQVSCRFHSSPSGSQILLIYIPTTCYSRFVSVLWIRLLYNHYFLEIDYNWGVCDSQEVFWYKFIKRQFQFQQISKWVHGSIHKWRYSNRYSLVLKFFIFISLRPSSNWSSILQMMHNSRRAPLPLAPHQMSGISPRIRILRDSS